MVHKRSIIAGMTDYTGVRLDDILADLREWQAMTRQAVRTLRGLRKSVEGNPAIFESPRAALEDIDYFCNLLERYAGDFDRVVDEIPQGVRAAHIEILSQIYRSSQFEEDACVRFKSRFIEHDLTNEDARPVLDEIYSESRSMLVDYLDLSNLVPRLRTFVAPSMSSEGILQLKPAFWGVGVDLKAVGRWLRRWWSRKQPLR